MIGLAKKFILLFPDDFMGKTKETFWPTQYIELSEGGKRNFSLCILNKHFRGLSCIFEFESHFFEFLNEGTN